MVAEDREQVLGVAAYVFVFMSSHVQACASVARQITQSKHLLVQTWKGLSSPASGIPQWPTGWVGKSHKQGTKATALARYGGILPYIWRFYFELSWPMDQAKEGLSSSAASHGGQPAAPRKSLKEDIATVALPHCCAPTPPKQLLLGVCSRNTLGIEV